MGPKPTGTTKKSFSSLGSEFGSDTDVAQVRQQKTASSGTKPTAGGSTMGPKPTGTTKKCFSSLGTEFGRDNDLRNRNNNNNNNDNR
jgi:gamma type small acid-soluble spore protein